MSSRIRWLTVILIVILVPANCWWVTTSLVYGGSSPTQISLYFNAIFSLLVLITINGLVNWFRPNQILFNRAELLTIYTCISVSSGLAGVDRMMVLAPLIGHAHWFASPENDWASLFHHYIPSWLSISNKYVLEGYYKGFSNFYTWPNLVAWFPIVFWWGLFLLVLHLVMLCINVILRKQWVESEKLSYPIIQLPMEMGNRRFFKSGWMWIGLVFGLTINLINGLNFLFPYVPSLGGKLYDLGQVFTERPWSAIGWSPIAVFPFGVGLSFFIPLDLSFSCWVFWLIWRLERITGAMMGWKTLPRFPYEPEQSHGAYIGLCVFAIWMSRHHLKRVLMSCFKPEADLASYQNIPVNSYKIALSGLVFGGVFIIIFCLKMQMSLGIIFFFFAIWFSIGVAITRLRAELGSPVHDLHFIGPDEILPSLIGTRRIGASNLVSFSYLYVLNRAHRSHAMPHQLEGFKIAEIVRTPLVHLVILMSLASLLGVVASFVFFLTSSYKIGARVWFANESFRRLEGWLTTMPATDFPAIIFVSFGFVGTILLSLLRMRFLWWNLHPVGYAISGSWAINPMIGSIFIGWLFKWIVLKHGGKRWHSAAVPLFLGVILGEFLGGTLWSILGIAKQKPMYRFQF